MKIDDEWLKQRWENASKLTLGQRVMKNADVKPEWVTTGKQLRETATWMRAQLQSGAAEEVDEHARLELNSEIRQYNLVAPASAHIMKIEKR